LPDLSDDDRERIQFSDGKEIAILGKAFSYKEYSTPKFTGGSSGSMVIDDNKVVVGINFAGASNPKDEYTSMQGYALFLNTKNSFFGSSYQYEIRD
jgi:hypothetical protein